MDQHPALAVDETVDDSASCSSEQWLLEVEREQLAVCDDLQKAACPELWTPISPAGPSHCRQKPPSLIIPQSPCSHQHSISSKPGNGDGLPINAGCSSAYRCLFLDPQTDMSLGSSPSAGTPCISEDVSSSRRQLQQWLFAMETNLSSFGKKGVNSSGSNPCHPGVTKGPFIAGTGVVAVPMPPPAFALLGLLG